MTTITPEIPGLEIPTPPATDIERQVDATIAALREAELLLPRHEAQVGLVQLLARKLGMVAGYGQAYGVAMLARELREALAALPDVPEGSDERDEFAQLVLAVRSASMGDSTGPDATD
jgi:hypothetical protein